VASVGVWGLRQAAAHVAQAVSLRLHDKRSVSVLFVDSCMRCKPYTWTAEARQGETGQTGAT
jgi:hypothetical protein